MLFRSFTGTIAASGYNDGNWNEAYIYSQVGHLPLAGGTMLGDFTSPEFTRLGTKSKYDTYFTGGIGMKDFSSPTTAEGGRLHFNNERWQLQTAGVNEASGGTATHLDVWNGTGYDAVVVDADVAEAATASKIVKRDSSGNIKTATKLIANAFSMEYDSTSKSVKFVFA